MVAVGDLNNDGKPDLVLPSESSAFVSVLINNGDGTFQSARSVSVGSGPLSVAIADVNGDGNADLAVANSFSETLSILKGNGDGSFQPATTISCYFACQTVQIADFNGDGRPDVLLAGYSGISVLLGNGDGTFGSATSGISGSGFSVAIGDFNGDGIPDIASVNDTNPFVVVFIGNGDGSFRGLPSNQLTYIPRQVLVADLNGDGKDDLILATGGYALTVQLGNGDGTFQAPVNYGSGIAIDVDTSVVVGDFNGDGVVDIAVDDYPNGDLALFLGNGDGTFSAGPVYPLTYHGLHNPMAVGDFNGDGKTDLAGIVLAASNSVAVLLGGAVPDLSIAITQRGAFTQGQSGAQYTLSVNNVGTASTNSAVGVVNTLPAGFTATSISGNGWTCVLATLACTRSDSLASGSSYPNIVIKANISGTLTGTATDTATVSGGGDQNLANNTATNSVMIRLNPIIALTSSPNPSTLGQPVTLSASVTSAATGRITFLAGSTVLGDAAVSNGQAALTTSLLVVGLNTLFAEYSGDATYGPAVSTVRLQTVGETALNGLSPLTSYQTDSYSQHVEIADLNRDGKLDLVVGTSTGVDIFLGNGDGTFQPETTYPVSGTTYTLAVVDVNSDGIADIVVGNGFGVYKLIGKGDGSFMAAVESLAIPAVNLMAVADFNLDGIPDLAIASGNAISILLGNGDGTFQSPIALAVSSGYDVALFAADFNGDGKPDLFTAAGVLLGNGDGTFQAPITFQTPIYPMAYALGDFNGDGRVDIAMMYWIGVAVDFGNGDGTFQAPISTAINTYATPGYFAIAGDFNGDGKLDIAFRGYCNNYFGIAFGKGDGTFQNTAPSFATDGCGGSASENIAVADLNGDGRPDFVIANPGSATGPLASGPIDVFLGAQFNGLKISSAHAGYFITGQTGDSYQLTVSNPNYLATSSTVTVTDTLPAGLTATAISGSGWSCTLTTLTCTRTDALVGGYTNSYPPITLTVNVTTSTPGTLTNRASVSYGGYNNSATDPTLILLPSTTTLSVSPSAAFLDQQVTLTATVSAGATGKVTFRDGVNLLGVAPIVGNQATFKTVLLPAGVRALIAFYEGDSTHATSASVAKPFTITAEPGSGFAPAINASVGSGASGLAIGDFNLDGIPDLVTANSSNSISILIGNGDGSFKPSANITLTASAAGVAVSDFNGDGKPDLAVASPSGSVFILVGNGDGTFQSPASYPAGNGATYVAVADFNRDGIADLAVGNLTDRTIAILIGSGTGSFQRPKIISSGSTPNSITVADFNGDGIADLLLPTAPNGYGDLLLGNGDGTFNDDGLGYGCTTATAGDINGDGYADVICATTSSVTVLLGNGNGAFTTKASYTIPTTPTAPPVVIADVNGDGKLDVVAGGSSLIVLLGNGDGTLQTPLTYNLGSQPLQMVTGGFNGTQRTGFAFLNGSSVSVLLGVLTPLVEVSSTHTGYFNYNSTGTYTLTVTNLGPGDFSGIVTVVDTLPPGMTGNSMGGTGWACTLATLTCTRNDSFDVGQSPPPITLVVNVGPTVSSPAVNSVMVTASGSIPENSTDSTIITAGPSSPGLISPANGATELPLNTTLNWGFSTGTPSYNVYFGTSSPPPFVTNVSGTSYRPAGLKPGTTYYWEIVATNAIGTNPSAIWSFTTGIVASKVGIWRPSVFNMVAEDVDGNIGWDAPPDRANFFGATGDIVIFGDWNGSGQSCMGIFRPSVAMFALDMNCNGAWDPGVDTFGFFGQNGDIPIVGDWTGDGKSKIGIFRPTTGLFALDINNNLAWDPGIDQAGKFGQPNDVPIVGEWTLDGKSKVGIFRNGLWELDTNGNLAWEAGVDSSGTIGQAGDTPLLGDWNGDGRTKVGIYRPSSGIFGLDYNGNLVWDNGIDRGGVLGPAGATPVVGDWTGSGISRVGIFYGNGYWALDTNGNIVWDAGIKWGAFGAAGDTPVVGKW
jgi:uncharacterized repeat protein (TIGR01451 family)